MISGIVFNAIRSAIYAGVGGLANSMIGGLTGMAVASAVTFGARVIKGMFSSNGLRCPVTDRDPKDVDIEEVIMEDYYKEQLRMQHEIAVEASETIWQRSIYEDNERAGLIYMENGQYKYMPSIKGKYKSFSISKLFRVARLVSIPRENIVAYYHSHGGYSQRFRGERFSGVYGDIGVANSYKIDAYLVTHRGKVKYYQHDTERSIFGWGVTIDRLKR